MATIRSFVGALCFTGATAALRRLSNYSYKNSTEELDSSSTSSGDYVGCNVGGTEGDCMDAGDCANNGGTAYAGYCPGPSNIQCCTNSNWGACSAGGQSGVCIGKDTCMSQGNTPISGACPGPVDVECCVSGGGPSGTSMAKALQFASATWNCDGGSPPCVGCATVDEGSSQTPYGCAPWVAQVLAYGGFVPGLSGCEDISNFGSVNGYNLNWVGGGGTGPGLMDYLQAMGWQATSSPTAGTVCAVYDYGHAVLGVGDNLCAAHNNARWDVPCDSYYAPYNLCLNPPA